MKTLGLIGGLSWQSTMEYYRMINQGINGLLGKNHSAALLMYSFDFQQIEELQVKGDWAKLHQYMVEAASRIYQAGADAVMICSNTMHLSAKEITENGIPVIHIVDATGQILEKQGTKKVGLLGTKYLMLNRLYPDILTQNFGIETIVPDEMDMERINTVIYNELVKGIIRESSKIIFLDIIEKMISKGIEGLILGCTEIPLLINENDVDLPVLNTTLIHSNAGIEFLLSDLSE